MANKTAARIIIVCGLLAVSLIIALSCARTLATPPVAERIPRVDTFHNEIITDNYFWLRDRENPKVIAYLEAENAYADSITQPYKDFRDSLYEEIKRRIKETDMEVPYKLDDYYYYTRTEEGKQYSIYCRKKGSLEGPEEILLDMNQLAEGKNYIDLAIFEPSPDHKILAYSLDFTGAERFTVYFKNLETGQLLADTIANTSYSLVWANDNLHVFYTIRDEANRPYQLYRHKLGQAGAADALVFQEDDDQFWLGIDKSKSRAYLLMGMGSNNTTEFYYLDANTPLGQFKLIAPRQTGIEYDVDHHGDKFYIVTNENAQNFKLMETPTANPAKENWKETIPHRPEVKLDDVELFKDFMVVWERQAGLQQVQIINFTNGEKYYIDFPEPVYGLSGAPNPDFNSKLLRFTYYSLVTPRSIYDYDMSTKSRELKKQQEVLGGYDPTLYKSERVMAVSHDGVKVPISLVYKKDLFKRDGSNPAYLYVYGAYGHSMDPYFSSSRLSLLNRGFVFGIPHVRGGGELGRPWYEDGKLLKKKNTFLDLIACAEYLTKEKYTSAKNLVISGASAGGLTVGAAVNMRPELFGIVVADVPFVDLINTMMDPSIPLTVIEYDEWGNPNLEEYYQYMRSYSPYDNVEAKAYPTIYITTSLNDPRVAYWEPAKWAAKLRATKTDNNLLILKTNMGAGHGGSSGRYDYLKDIAFEYAFILNHFGIRK